MGTFLVYFFGLLVVGGLLFLVASFAFGRGEELAPTPKDTTPLELPDDRPMTGQDLRTVRLPVVFRGYRMTEVDWLIEELADALDDRDHEIAMLRAASSDGSEPPPAVDPSPARHAKHDDAGH